MSFACREVCGDGTGPMCTNPFINQEEIIMKRQMLMLILFTLWVLG